MTINAKAFGMASGLVAGATFALCALAIVVSPGSTMAFLGWVLHIDLSTMATPITLVSFCGGLILFSIFIGLCAMLTGQLYNRFAVTM